MPGGGRAGSGARQGNHSSRSETGQCQGHAPGPGEGAGLRLGESDLGIGGEPGPLAVVDGDGRGVLAGHIVGTPDT